MELVRDLRILVSCYFFCIFLYGFLIISIEFTSSVTSLIVLPIIIFVIIKVTAIPRPPDADIKNILGIDIWQQYKESIANKNDSVTVENDAPIFRTIAHRAAGLDAPENSISGLKHVSKI